MNTEEFQQKSWSPLQKITFRLLFTYIILYVLTLLLSPLLESTLRWFGTNILGYTNEIKLESTGSGDRSFDYVRLVFSLLLTFIITGLWSLLDTKRKNYQQHFNLLTRIIRVILLLAMLLYGFGKLFKGQFADHSFEKLVQTVGELSPMGLAWTFMGHSFAYNIFIALSEIIAGVLLLSKRTKTLGSIIILGVMTNVFMMNMTYDIPVKLVSFHIILLALVLLYTDKDRLLHFFFKNKNVPQSNYEPAFKNPKTQTAVSSIKKLVLVLILATVSIQLLVQFKVRDQLKEKSALYGLWKADSFQKNSQILQPLTNDTYRWEYFIFEEKNKAVIKRMTGEIDRFEVTVDTVKHQLTFSSEKNSDKLMISYKKLNANHLEFKGVFYGDTLTISFKKMTREDFTLTNRKFHWINEQPFQ